MGVMMANPIILAVCVGTILSNLVFGGLVVTFFPIYANGLGIGQAMIGSLFATRALASTVARLPAGVLGTIFPGYFVMLAALIISTIVAFSLPQFASPTILMFLLIGEGVAYGLFLTSGQTTIAEHADESSRGAALGIYMAAASVGDSVAPLFLGMVADRLGDLQCLLYRGWLGGARRHGHGSHLDASAGGIVKLPARVIVKHPLEEIRG